MAITISKGLFSGLDTDQLISQLMAVEKRPLQVLNVKKASFEAKISSYGSLSSTLSTLKGTLASLKSGSIFSMAAASTDSTVFTVSATTSASEGSYQVKINNIATSQSIYSSTFSLDTAAVADLSTYTTQKIKVKVGTNTAAEITVDSSNNTLTGIRDAINKANAGVRASVVNDGTNYRLILSSNTTGASNRITITVDEDNDGTFEEATAETDTTGLSKLAFNATYDSSGNVTGGTANMTQSQAALDASLVVDGLTITRGSNTISDIITGVTINLLKDSAGKTLTLSVSKDLAKITANVNAFAGAYNTAIGLARSLSASSDGKTGILTGDSTARGIITGLQSTLTTSFAGRTPASFGLSHDRKGVLSLDTKIFEGEVKAKLQQVIDTFDGMAKSLENRLTDYINTMIPERTRGLNSSIDQIENSIDNLEKRLVQIESGLRKKFAALEKTLGQLQQSGDFLTQQLSVLSANKNVG